MKKLISSLIQEINLLCCKFLDDKTIHSCVYHKKVAYHKLLNRGEFLEDLFLFGQDSKGYYKDELCKILIFCKFDHKNMGHDQVL